MRFKRERFDSISADRAAAVAQRFARVMQDFTPEEVVAGLSLAIVTLAEQENVDLSHVMHSAARRKHDLDTYTPEKMRALQDFLRWQMRDYSRV